MHIEYKIKYKIDGDIPINPSWIRDQLNASVQALQKEISFKLQAAMQQDTIYLQRLKLQAPSTKVLDSHKIPDIK